MMEFFFLYILKCNDNSYYVGHTDSIDKRLAQHQSGELHGYTSLRLPVELVFLQSFQNRDEAFMIEHKIKNWSKAKKEALIDSNWNELRKQAKKKF